MWYVWPASLTWLVAVLCVVLSVVALTKHSTTSSCGWTCDGCVLPSRCPLWLLAWIKPLLVQTQPLGCCVVCSVCVVAVEDAAC
jgi:hypothetical protein